MVAGTQQIDFGDVKQALHCSRIYTSALDVTEVSLPYASVTSRALMHMLTLL